MFACEPNESNLKDPTERYGVAHVSRGESIQLLQNTSDLTRSTLLNWKRIRELFDGIDRLKRMESIRPNVSHNSSPPLHESPTIQSTRYTEIARDVPK